MLDEMIKKSPKRIRIEDYRDYMPYKVCTGGSFFSFVTLERLKDNTYKKYLVQVLLTDLIKQPENFEIIVSMIL